MIIEKFTNFDYIVISIILISTIFALIKGLIRSFISILSWVITLSLIYVSDPYTKILVKKFVKNNYAIGISSVVVGFILSLIISSVFTEKLYRLTDKIRGGFIDRICGAVFGILRGCLIGCIIITFSTSLGKLFFFNHTEGENYKVPKFIVESQTYPVLRDISKMVGIYIPGSIKDEFNKIGKYSKETKSIDEENSDIEDLIKLLSPNDKNIIDSSDISKLQNKNLSKDEKIKILESIQNTIEQKSNNSSLKEMIKNILIPTDNGKKDDDQLNRLMDVK